MLPQMMGIVARYRIEIWNPWWSSTFYIPADNSIFRLAGIDYRWLRSWYNWQDGLVSSK